MGNSNYLNGRAKEYRLKYKFEKQGFIVLRTAQSRGFADLIAINPNSKEIIFIQSKPKSMSKNAKEKLEKQFDFINNSFLCAFQVK